MNLQLEHLNWDSDFFGYKTGQLVLPENYDLAELELVLKSAYLLAYKLIYIRTNETGALQFAGLKKSHNILLTDRKVTFFQQPDTPDRFYASPRLLPYEKQVPDKKLVALALQSGIFSRFAIDPNFRNNEFEKLYTEWITRSVTGELAREVWVSLNEKEEINGLLTLSLKNDIPDIGLLAVDTQSRGLNKGTQLVAKAKERAIAWGKSSLQVVTQLANEPACKFYEKCGFQQRSLEYIFHLWL